MITQQSKLESRLVLKTSLPILPDRTEEFDSLRLPHRSLVWANYQIVPTLALDSIVDFENWLIDRGFDPCCVALEKLAGEYLQERGCEVYFGFEAQSPFGEGTYGNYNEWFNSCDRAIAAARQHIDRHRLDAIWYRQVETFAWNAEIVSAAAE